jgi:hypothetical protein
MPLFECSRCKGVDNTALGSFWQYHSKGVPPLCVECETGTWHGVFPKKTAEERGLVPDGRGTLMPPGGWK